MIDTSVVVVFAITAVATGHEHWLKEHNEVLAITDPLNAWIEQLPPRKLKALEANICPLLFAAGVVSVVVPDIAQEMAIRNANHGNAKGQEIPGSVQSNASAAGTSEVHRGADAGYDRNGKDGFETGIHPARDQVNDNYLI